MSIIDFGESFVAVKSLIILPSQRQFKNQKGSSEAEMTEMILNQISEAAVNCENHSDSVVNEASELVKHIRRESNPQPSVPKTDALSN